MKAVAWTYRRVGQIFCFGTGFFVMGKGGEDGLMPMVLTGAVLMIVGLGLRQQMLQGFKRTGTEG